VLTILRVDIGYVGSYQPCVFNEDGGLQLIQTIAVLRQNLRNLSSLDFFSRDSPITARSIVSTRVLLFELNDPEHMYNDSQMFLN
jgi:hypothetical protein